MDTRKPAGCRNFSLLGWTEFLKSPWKRVIDTIPSSFRRECVIESPPILQDNPDAGWLLKEVGPTTEKSAEDIQDLRKATMFAIHESHAALAETIADIARIIGNRSLDSETKSTIRNGLDARFDRLRRKLDKDEGALDECNTALSKMFTRRSSDNRAHGQSVHI